MKARTKDLLEVISLEIVTYIADKFACHIIEGEPNMELRAHMVRVIGENLGKITEVAQFPTHWQRFLKRTDCPNYMKELTTLKIEEHYPKLALPEEEHWVTFRGRIEKA